MGARDTQAVASTLSQHEPGPLAGIRALDLTQGAAGPVSMSYLAMLGAEVIKIEPPAGDQSRYTKPVQGGMGTTFMGNNLCKLGVMLDLKSEGDLQVAKDLVKVSDIVLDNYRSPQVLAKLGLGYDVIRELNPQIIYIQSSAWGASKSYAGMFSHEWIAQPMCGVVGTTGEKGGPSEFTKGIAHCDWFAAIVNLQSMLIALQQRSITGKPMMVETCQYASSICSGFTRMIEYLGSGDVPTPFGNERSNVVPELVVKASDGEIAIAAPTSSTWRRLCEVVALGESFAPMSMKQRIAAREEITDALRTRFKQRTSDEWCASLHEARVPYAQIDQEQMLSQIIASHPQVRAEGMVKTMSSTRGELKVAKPPWSFSRTPAEIWKSFPELGEHRMEVLDLASRGDAGRERQQIGSESPAPPGRVLPLDGVRVLDLSQGIIGPFAAMQLGSLGALVTKIESPEGDWLRFVPPFAGDSSALFDSCNRNKRGIRLDPDDEEDVRALRLLVLQADVVIVGDGDERVWPDLSYEDCARENPGLIWGEVSAFGQTGPLGGQSATELTIQMAVGLNRHFGESDREPVREGFDIASMATSGYLHAGLLAALLSRHATGQGQKVGVSMLAAMVAMSEWNLAAENQPDEAVGLTLEAYRSPAFHGFVLKDRVVNIDLRGDGQAWDLFFIAIDRAELCSNELFNGAAAILRNKTALLGELAPTLSQWSFEDLSKIIRDLDGAIAPIMDCDEVLQFSEADGLYTGMEGDIVDKISRPWRFSDLNLPAGRPFEAELKTG